MKRKNSSERRHSHLNSAAHQILTTPSSRSRPSEDLKLQIEELVYELQQKDVTIASLQRNYEGVSSLIKGEHSWKDTVACLEREKAILQSKLQILESMDISTLRSENEKLNLAIDSKNKEISALLKKIDTLQSEAGGNTRDKEEIKHLNAQIERIRELGLEKDAIIENLTKQNDILLKNEERYHDESLRINREIEETKQEMINAQKKLVGVSEELTESWKVNHGLNQQIAELNDKIDCFNRYKIMSEDEIFNLNKRIEELTHKCKILNTQETNKVSELTLTIHRLTEENKKLIDKLKTLEDYNSKMNNTFEDEKTKIIAKFELEIEIIKKELQENVKNATNQLQQQIKSLEVENEKLKRALNLHDKEKSELESHLSSLESEKRTLLGKIKSLESEKQVLEVVNGSLEQDKKDHTNLLKTQQSRISSQEKENLSLKERLSYLQSQEALIEELNEKLKKSESFLPAISDLQGKLKRKSDKLRKAQEWSSKFEHEHQITSHENSYLKEKVMNQSKEIIELKHLQYKISNLENTLTKLRDKDKSQQALIAQMTSELNHLKRNSSHDEHNLVNRIEYMKGELERYRPSELESQREIKQHKSKQEFIERSVEQLHSLVSQIELKLLCQVCFQKPESPSLNIPCKHIVCRKCRNSDTCTQCDRRLSSVVSLSLFDEFLSKIAQKKKIIEEMKKNIFIVKLNL